MASFCAYSAWYIFPRWRRSRTPTGHPLGRLIYGGTVSSCSPLIPRSAPLPAPPFPLFSFPIYVPVRLACRLVGRLAMPSRLMRSVAVVRRVVRRAVSSARLVSLVVSYGRRFVLLFARSRLVCRGVIALRSRAASFCPWHFVSFVVSPAVSPVILLAHLVLARHLILFCHVGCSCPFSCPFPCSHRSALLVARSCSPIRSRFMSPLCGGAVRHGHGAGTACSYRLIRPIIALIRYSLIRCGMVAGG